MYHDVRTAVNGTPDRGLSWGGGGGGGGNYSMLEYGKCI